VKNSINQIKYSVESITNRLDQEEKRISGFESKIKEILHSNTNKEKNNMTTTFT
jgi:hypothetical protein